MDDSYPIYLDTEDRDYLFKVTKPGYPVSVFITRFFDGQWWEQIDSFALKGFHNIQREISSYINQHSLLPDTDGVYYLGLTICVDGNRVRLLRCRATGLHYRSSSREFCASDVMRSFLS